MKRIKEELSPQSRERSSCTEEQSVSLSPLRKHSKVEQSSLSEGHSSKAQLDVSAHIFLYSFTQQTIWI